jgi:hypothetical protein
MQFQAHLDYTSGKKSAFSPAPGGSMHEAGRSLDLDLGSLKISLAQFWDIAAKYGLSPIIKEPKTSLKEAWHFDCRGSHGKIYEYYAAGKGTDRKPYEAMAASAILSAGLRHDAFVGRETEAGIQSGLIRLGYELGNFDGQIGMKTKMALQKAGLPDSDLKAALEGVENLIQKSFPDEFRMTQPISNGVIIPDHVIS